MTAVCSVTRLAFAALPLLLLAACGGGMPMPADGPPPAGPGASAAPAPAHSGTRHGEPRALASDPAALKGLTMVQLRAALGSPGFTRRDAPAEIWQYRGRDCTLDLFLYDSSAGPTVQHFAVRSPQVIPAADCLSELLRRDRTTVSQGG